MTICRAYPENSPTITKLEKKLDIEPALEDMLAESIIQLVMKRDGVSPADVERVIHETRHRLMAAEIHPRAAAA